MNEGCPYCATGRTAQAVRWGMSSRRLSSTALRPHSWGSGGPTPLPPAAHSRFGEAGGLFTQQPTCQLRPHTTRLQGPASSSRAQCRRKPCPWGTVTPRGVVLPGLTYVFLLRMKRGGTPRCLSLCQGAVPPGPGACDRQSEGDMALITPPPLLRRGRGVPRQHSRHGRTLVALSIGHGTRVASSICRKPAGNASPGASSAIVPRGSTWQVCY